MRTNRATRVTFSGNEISISLPASWTDLTQEELGAIYATIALFGRTTDVRHIVLMELARMSRLPGEDGWRYAIKAEDSDGQTITKVIELTPESEAGFIDKLSWLSEPGTNPARLDSMRGHDAVDAKFHGVPFGDYLVVENLYQGFMQSENPAALVRAAHILYPGFDADELRGSEEINVLNWLVQVKGMFSERFRHFFRPTGASSEGEEPTVEDITNNQVRALTGGDVTKEKEIMAIDCWRALTELDYKSKEADDFRKERAKIKSK